MTLGVMMMLSALLKMTRILYVALPQLSPRNQPSLLIREPGATFLINVPAQPNYHFHATGSVLGLNCHQCLTVRARNYTAFAIRHCLQRFIDVDCC